MLLEHSCHWVQKHVNIVLSNVFSDSNIKSSPYFARRLMSTLLRNRGVIVSNIIVFVDGVHPEVEQLCSLLDIKCVSQVCT